MISGAQTLTRFSVAELLSIPLSTHRVLSTLHDPEPANPSLGSAKQEVLPWRRGRGREGGRGQGNRSRSRDQCSPSWMNIQGCTDRDQDRHLLQGYLPII